MRRDFIYVALCLILPALWGIISAQVFDRCQGWIAKKRVTVPPSDARLSPPLTEESSPDMYHI